MRHSPPPFALRVLVVEDDPDSAQTLALLLRLWGYEVAVANDGPDASIAVMTAPPRGFARGKSHRDFRQGGSRAVRSEKRAGESSTSYPPFCLNGSSRGENTSENVRPAAATFFSAARNEKCRSGL